MLATNNAINQGFQANGIFASPRWYLIKALANARIMNMENAKCKLKMKKRNDQWLTITV